MATPISSKVWPNLIFRYAIVHDMNLIYRMVENEKSYSGFYISWIMQFSGGFNYMIIFCVLLSMEIGLCGFIDVCSTDLERIITKMSEKKSRPTAQLREAIELHHKMIR